jgi:hypothetical protein
MRDKIASGIHQVSGAVHAKGATGALKDAAGAIKDAASNVNPATVAIAAGVAGAAIFVAYLRSKMRMNYLIKHYQKKLSQTSDPTKKAAIQAKIKKAQARIDAINAKARIKKAKFIQQTREMNDQLSKMKASGADSGKIASLQKKIQKRQAVMSKIGAKL